MSERPRASYYIVEINARERSVNSPQSQAGSGNEGHTPELTVWGERGVRQACDNLERASQRQPQEKHQQQQRRSTITRTRRTTISVRQQKQRQAQQQNNTSGNNDSNKTGIIRITLAATIKARELAAPGIDAYAGDSVLRTSSPQCFSTLGRLWNPFGKMSIFRPLGNYFCCCIFTLLSILRCIVVAHKVCPLRRGVSASLA